MKKILFVCIVMLAVNQNIFSQKNDKKVTIQTSPFLLFSDIFTGDVNDSLFIMDLETQFKASNYSNISITLSFLYNDRIVNNYDYSSPNNSNYKETYYQIGFKPMYVHRPFGTGLRGFFIGFYPNLGFRLNAVDEKNTLYTEVGFGLNLGYKWVFDSGFTMQFGGGVGKTFSFPKKPAIDVFINSDGRLTLVNSDFSIDFKLGYSF